jgi:hypothetical protein
MRGGSALRKASVATDRRVFRKHPVVTSMRRRAMPKERAARGAQPDHRGSMSIRGSSLVESLVAVSILSVGSAATGTWIVHSALGDLKVSRLLAADAIASSLEARMRSNAAGSDHGAYLNQEDATACVWSCAAADLAADDMWRFRGALARHLGAEAEGSVRCAPSKRCVIHIAWRGKEVLAWPLER